MSYPEKEYITAKESLVILNISSIRTLQRYSNIHEIKTKEFGNGKPKLYLKSDIEKISKPKKDIAKYIPKKTKEKIKKVTDKKKQVSQKRIKDNKDSKEKAEDIKVPPHEEKKDFSEAEKNPLNDLGKDEFLRVEKLLIDRGTYKDEDRGILLAYAISYQNYLNAVVQSGYNDNTTTDDFGNLKVHPYFTIADKCLSQMTKLSNMVGISVRGRIGVEIKKKKTGLMRDILSRKNK